MIEKEAMKENNIDINISEILKKENQNKTIHKLN